MQIFFSVDYGVIKIWPGYDFIQLSLQCKTKIWAFVVLLTFLAHNSSSSCRTDASEVIVHLLAGSTVTAGLGVTWPVGMDRQSVLQRDCGCGGLGWSRGGWCGCGGPAAGEGPSGGSWAECGKCRSGRERSGSGSCDWRYSGRGGGEERNSWKA